MSVQQLIPGEQVSEYFSSQLHVPLSVGSVCNFKQAAYTRLEQFETWTKEPLKNEKVLNLDETGIPLMPNALGYTAPQYTLYMPHQKRGREAIDAMGIVPHTKAMLIHDHWKPVTKGRYMVFAMGTIFDN